MAMCGTRRLGKAAQIGLAGLLLGLSLSGCEHGTSDRDDAKGTAIAKSISSGTANSDIPVPADPRLCQTFAEATRPDPPADWQRPPDLTLTGNSVGNL